MFVSPRPPSPAAGAPLSDETAWVIERFTSLISIRPDGSLGIVELIDVDFLSLRDRHGVFREIPVQYRRDATTMRVFELDVDEVSDATGRAVPFAVNAHGANVQVKIGDPNRIVTGKQRYRLAYRVRGALDAFPDHDELYWNVNGAEWPVEMLAVGSTVDLRAGGIQRVACFQGPGGSTEPCRATSGDERSAGFVATRPLAPGEQLTIVVGIRKGVLPEPVPIVRPMARSFEDWFEVDPPRLAFGFVALAAALGLVLRTWLRRGRDEAGERADVLVAEYGPPDDLRPAHLGLILDERADPKDLTATIVDLAVRGYLTIEETAGAGLFSRTDWTLRSAGRDRAGLRPYEIELLDGLFEKGESVAISSLKGTFADSLEKAQRKLYDESVERRWFPSVPDAVRGRWAAGGAGVIVLGAVLAAALGLLLGAGLAGLAVSASGVALVLVSPSMPKRTTVGRELLRRTRGFRHYMEVAERDRQRFAERESLFTDFLPYAIVFGCVDRWARAFEGLATEPQAGNWYSGPNQLNAVALSRSLESFSSNVSSTIVTRPGGGGSGFSGGGSGGGGGGGGGGSW